MAKCILPDYVKNFKCDGKLCGARCCRDWRIVVDEKTYEKFLPLEEITKNIEWSRDPTHEVDVMTIKLRDDGICSFLDEDCLCSIQKKHGENFLTAICQSFPRVTYKLDDETFQQSMTLTCPVAAQLILLAEEPMTFSEVDNVTARAVIELNKHFPRSVKSFLEIQRNAIKILQDRNSTINRRLKNFYELFGGKILRDVEFNLKNHSLTLVEIFNKMYGADLNFAKKNDLCESYALCREKILGAVHENFSNVLENYLVNEFFMRCYPVAFSGDELYNCKIFIASYRLLEFALVLTVIAHPRLTLNGMANLILSVNDMLDHSHGGMDALIDFVKTCDDKTFASTMLES